MKKYLLDTNVLLRFLLKDNARFSNQALSYLEQAKKNKIKLVLLPYALIEMDYAMREVYRMSKNETINLLDAIAKTPYIDLKDRTALLLALDTYKQKNIDLFDLYLFFWAKNNKLEVLSFDRDFSKLT